MSKVDVIDLASDNALASSFELVRQHLDAGSPIPTRLLVNWLRAMQIRHSLDVPLVLLSSSPTDLALRKSCELSGRALQLIDLIRLLTNREDVGSAPDVVTLL